MPGGTRDPLGLRRRWFTVAVAASGAFIAVYVPHVARVGAKVVGFLPGYLQQENYTSGTRYGIIGLFIIGPLATVVALLILAAVAFAVLQFSPPDRPWAGAVVMTAAALAVATPHYQWYSLLLVMLVALDGRPEWLAFAAGGYYAAYPALGARYYIPPRLQERRRVQRAAGGRGGRLADQEPTGQARGPGRRASGHGASGHGASGHGASGHGASGRGRGRGAGRRDARGRGARIRGPGNPGLSPGMLSYRLVTPRANIKRHPA